jgi:hypothetical protein
VLIGAIAAPREAAAIGNAATHFTVFAPPNNSNNGRHSMLIVTAQSSGTNGRTQVDIVDDGADGDSDDSYSVSLARGQSQVIYLRDGAINDDAGGVWDGDLFDVRSDAPVTVLLATRSDWEHDWVPGDNNRMLSQSFFILRPTGRARSETSTCLRTRRTRACGSARSARARRSRRGRRSCRAPAAGCCSRRR